MAFARSDADRVLATIDRTADEIVDFTAELIRIPTVNPPGNAYAECAQVLGARMLACGFETAYVAAEGRPEHTPTHPRINVVGRRRGRRDRPTVHLNGHIDVVPAGSGWTMDPFGGVVRDRRIYGRGACDMKAGIAAALYAAEAIRRTDVALNGTIELSGTVDEESGGFAGVAYLAEHKRLSADQVDYVIIPEPLNVDRVCIGHRGVYWFEVETRGRIAHGSMPFLGVNAIDHMAAVIDHLHHDLASLLATRTTTMPVMPEAARHATLNINGIAGGQAVDGIQTPCVADVCRAVFDRRFLPEEDFVSVKREIETLLTRLRRTRPDLDVAIRDLMVVPPVRTPEGSPLVHTLEQNIARVLGRPATQVASPGTYDHKHVDRIGGIRHCVAYGPGILDLAHQPDEWCGVDDLVNATKVIALTLLELLS
jgi:succinyl-diaminopimelate desuccinylase